MIYFFNSAAVSPQLCLHFISFEQSSNLPTLCLSKFFLLLAADWRNHLLFPAAASAQFAKSNYSSPIERQTAGENRFGVNFQTAPLYLMHREAWFCLYCRYKAIKQNNLTKHVAAGRESSEEERCGCGAAAVQEPCRHNQPPHHFCHQEIHQRKSSIFIKI